MRAALLGRLVRKSSEEVMLEQKPEVREYAVDYLEEEHSRQQESM